jgi:hypothetical protein
MAVRPKGWVCSLLIGGIAGSNPTEGTDARPSRCFLCSVGSGYFQELIIRLEESCRVCECVCL